MHRIIALNGQVQQETNEEDFAETWEAQETIAETEYLRAIKLKKVGKVNSCLHLLKELLQTQVLNENIKDKRKDKLCSIKYNCHKNIAAILEEKCEYKLALQHYISAALIDNSDVYMLYNFGQLALKLGATDLAEYAFETCLCKNVAHWCAAEGMLQVMNTNYNLIGSYNCVSKILLQFTNNEKALKFLKGVSYLLRHNLCYFRNIKINDSILVDDLINEKLCFSVVFSETQNVQQKDDNILDVISNIEEFYIKQLNWFSIGYFIMDVYYYLRSKSHNIYFLFNLNDVIGSIIDERGTRQHKSKTQTKNRFKMDLTSEQECILEVNEVKTDPSKLFTAEKCNTSMDSNTYDSDTTAKSESNESTKAKPRRRSDLHFLEQWGWHKNRRYSSRKKTERDETDLSLNGYLRKMLTNYSEISFDDNWPFCDIFNNGNHVEDEVKCPKCSTMSNDIFQISSGKEFEKLISILKENRIDLMVLIFKWLKYVSIFWDLPLPPALRLLYINVYEIYIRHFDLSTWNQLTPNNFEASYRICMFYLELNVKNHLNNNSDLWLTIFYHLMVNISNLHLCSKNNVDIYRLRLLYLEYLLFNKTTRFTECVICLQQMDKILRQVESSFSLHLPNFSKVCINSFYIQNLLLRYTRYINVYNIPKLYQKCLWSELVSVIVANIEVSENNFDDDDWLQDIIVQMEILLQSLWMMGTFENCLIWSEKCFHFAVTHYLQTLNSSFRRKLLAELINFVTSYVEAIIINEGFHIVIALKKECLSRLVQNIIRMLVYQFEGTFEKNSSHGQDINFKRTWVILHQLVLREESNSSISKGNNEGDTGESIPNSFSILFTAHEYLGKRQWCTNDNGEFLQYILDSVLLNLRAPIYDACRDIIYEYLEQVTYCLYKYPQKKARSKHLEDHEVSQVEFCWLKAVQVFDLFRPEHLPEFNSYKLETINSDMEQLLLRIISLIPQELDPSTSVHRVTMFIEGQCNSPPSEVYSFKMPYKILSLYYLLADFYFKNRDFTKAIKFYTLDLVVNSNRFDSWAGIALSKASKLETKLNGLDPISMDTIWGECEEVLRCFERCININRFQVLLWIEYGCFSYIIHSYFSRNLKQNSMKLSAELLSCIGERKNKMLNVAFNCFSFASNLQHSISSSNYEENSDANDDKWLCQYMLGKISEKRREQPKIYLNHYLMAANYLYENSATYPIKINHSNPTTLSVEALEVFYRTNAAIIKYLQNENDMTRYTGDLFMRVLKNLSTSPFAYNKAKVDGNWLNILKGKLDNKVEPQSNSVKHGSSSVVLHDKSLGTEFFNLPTIEKTKGSKKFSSYNSHEDCQSFASVDVRSSAALLARSPDTSTLGSTSESDDSLIENEGILYKNVDVFSPEELKAIYKMVIQNIEECATRFPEHYKSIYRLVFHYMNTRANYFDLCQSEKLLLGQYTTSLGNLVNGLFYDRKHNNLFNGIWRIPSSEIDRPGSFSAHLVKCVRIFIQLLYKTNNHTVLIDVAITLHKTPDLDKRYIRDDERRELCELSVCCCEQVLRSTLSKNFCSRDDAEVLNLLIDIYKVYKKCVKYLHKKEPLFADLLVEVYKFLVRDRSNFFPDNYNYLDLAMKLSAQEIAAQKNSYRSTETDNITITQDSKQSQISNEIEFLN